LPSTTTGSGPAHATIQHPVVRASSRRRDLDAGVVIDSSVA